MAKIVGWVVMAAFLAGLFGATANKLGLASAAVIWGIAIGGAGAVTWAIGAILHNDWWPFHYL